MKSQEWELFSIIHFITALHKLGIPFPRLYEKLIIPSLICLQLKPELIQSQTGRQTEPQATRKQTKTAFV